MPRVHDFQPSFNAGEITDRLSVRTDFSKFRSALDIGENIIVLGEGGAMRRAGTRHVDEVSSSTVKHRLRPFEFSTTQAYMLALGDFNMRFHRWQGTISVADTDAAITNGQFTSNINDWDDRSTGTGSIAHDSTNGYLNLVPGGATGSDIGWAEQDVTVGASFQNEEHVIKFRVIGAPGDKIEFQVGTTSTGTEVIGPLEREVGYHCVAFTPGATTFYVQFRNLGANKNKTLAIDNVSLIDDSALEVETPWPEADLFDVSGPQSADELWLFHGSHPTHILQRFGNTTWSLVQADWLDGPYLDMNTTSTTLNPSANSGAGITLTFSSTTGVNGGDGLKSTDVGRLVRYKKTSTWGSAIITEVTSSTVAVADVISNFESSPTAVDTWHLGAWSGTTGYPQVATFFEQRLYVAGTTDQPQTFWASQVANYRLFRPDDRTGTVEADDAFGITLASNNVDAIQWISAGQGTLIIGTIGSEWVPSSADGTTINPDSDIVVRLETRRGSAKVDPLQIESTTLFVQRGNRKLREFGYSINTDGYVTPDMTRLAEHVTRSGIVEMAYAQEPESLVYAARDDGQLLTMTYRRDEDVVGWTRHILGGDLYVAPTKVMRVDDEAVTDVTTDATDAGDADFTPFPASETTDDYVAFGYTKPFDKIVVDYANGTAGIGGAVNWEYWTGTQWADIVVTDGTSGFTASAADGLTVTWDIPSDWHKRVLTTESPLYYIRAKITTAYTTNPVLDQVFITDAPVVESVATIPGDDGTGQVQDSSTRDEVWVVVRRTINGTTKRYIEVFERTFETDDDPEDAYYSDSLITYDGALSTTITGLDHLEGETVKILADGAVHADKTVSSGQITLDEQARTVQVGLPYAHRIHTLTMDAGNPAGTAVGKTRRITKLGFTVMNTYSIAYGPTFDNLQMKDFREVADSMDAPPPLFTGIKVFAFDGRYSIDPRVAIKSDSPTPFTLLSLQPVVDVNPQL